jgi:hypothetical protein
MAKMSSVLCNAILCQAIGHKGFTWAITFDLLRFEGKSLRLRLLLRSAVPLALSGCMGGCVDDRGRGDRKIQILCDDFSTKPYIYLK